MHLIHPALVHFAVAFLVAGCLLEAWGLIARRDAQARFGGALVIAGTIVLLPTVASGYLAVNSVTLSPLAEAAAGDHERAGIIIILVFFALLLWKGWYRGSIPVELRRVYAAALIAALALVIYGAFLGGRLVYGFGVGTSAGMP